MKYSWKPTKCSWTNRMHMILPENRRNKFFFLFKHRQVHWTASQVFCPTICTNCFWNDHTSLTKHNFYVLRKNKVFFFSIAFKHNGNPFIGRSVICHRKYHCHCRNFKVDWTFSWSHYLLTTKNGHEQTKTKK